MGAKLSPTSTPRTQTEGPAALPKGEVQETREALKTALLFPHEKYKVQPGDNLFSVARGIEKADLIPGRTLGEIKRALQEFLGSEQLSAGSLIDIPAFLKSQNESKDAFTPVPGATFGNKTYTVKAGDSLFSILRSYRDTLPQTKKYASLREADVMDFVITAQRLRREKLKIPESARLPHIKPGDQINLKTIFHPEEQRRTEQICRGERGQHIKGREESARFLEPSEVAQLALRASRELARDGIHIEPALLMAQAKKESTFDAHAFGRAKERGICQLKVEAAQEVWPDHWEKFNVMALYDPFKCMYLAGAYLEKKRERFGNIRDGLAAYNHGTTRWLDILDDSPTPDKEAMRKGYVREILSNRDIYQRMFFNEGKLASLVRSLRGE